MRKNDFLNEEIKIKHALEVLGFFQPLESYKFIGGISNNNYLINDKYVLRIPYRSSNSDCVFPYEMEDLAFKAGIGPRLINKDINTRYKLTKYLNNSECIPFDKYDNNMLNFLIEGIRCIHDFKPTTYRVLDYYEDIKKRLNTSLDVTRFIPKKDYVDFLDNFRPLYEKLMRSTFPSHIDLVNSNVLYDGKVMFIDFEYAAYTFKDFDLVSLLSENEINEQTTAKIIERFYPLKSEHEEFLRKLPLLKKSLDFYWLLWALDMLTGIKEKDEVFLSIAKIKADRFNQS